MAGTAIPQRVRGDDVSVLITQDGDLQDTLVDVVDMDATFMVELISKGYLGEPSERKDMIFKGVSFKITLHLHTQDFVRFINAIVSKAKRLTPDTVFSITGVFSFPNGDTPELQLDDCSFKPVPVSTKSRGDYTDVTFEGECADIDFQTS
jgi:hypothetical protein